MYIEITNTFRFIVLTSQFNICKIITYLLIISFSLWDQSMNKKGVEKNESIITASAFSVSIEKALLHIPDAEVSIKRITNTLNSLPSNKIYISNSNGVVVFHAVVNGKQCYISSKDNKVHSLARRRYLQLLQQILELSNSVKPSDIRRRQSLLKRLQKTVTLFEQGNLDLSKIVLTGKQYNWFRSDYQKKYIDPASPITTVLGEPVRSKSERDITNGFISLAVPYHYEEQNIIYVRPFVDILKEQLTKKGSLKGQLFVVRNNTTQWFVPAELEWLNSRGSIWRTYDPYDGTVELFNDFMIMLADGTIIIWEHEGLMDDFIYRCNSSERISIMNYTRTVNTGNLIETFEQDIDTTEKISSIIEHRILPRLWF